MDDTNQTEDEILLPIQRVTKMLGKSAQTLRLWEKKGILIPVRIGGMANSRRMYKTTDIKKLMEGATTNG